ncbi:MAG: hypothetical protein ACRDHY_11415, partial [Anaerolineales bacterium]
MPNGTRPSGAPVPGDEPPQPLPRPATPATSFDPGPGSPLRDPLRPRPSEGRELAELRTETTKQFLNPDGTFTTEAYTRPIHFRDVSGGWADIDDNLVADGGDRRHNRSGRSRVEVAGTAQDP